MDGEREAKSKFGRLDKIGAFLQSLNRKRLPITMKYRKGRKRMLILKNAKILTMDSAGTIENGFVAICDQKIQMVGEMKDYSLDETGYQIHSLGGAWILPGFIDAHSHLGLFNDGLDFEGDDGNENTDPITPQIRGIDGIFNGDVCFREAYEAGVSMVMTGPGSANVMGGQFAILHTYRNTVEEAVVRPFAAQKAAFGENPKKVYGKENKLPATRMGAAAILRETLYKAIDYVKKWETYEQKMAAREPESSDEQPDPPDFDFQLDSLKELIRGEIPLKIHAHRQDDILTAVRLSNEFGLKYTLDHCTEGYLIADFLRDEYVAGKLPGRGTGNRENKGGKLLGVIIGPVICDRAKPELSRLSIRAASILKRAGLPVAIMTDHPCVPQQYLPLSSSLTVKGGMDCRDALLSITLEAAQILGVDEEYGSVTPGKYADLTIFSGDPFDYKSKVLSFLGQGIIRFDPDGLFQRDSAETL